MSSKSGSVHRIRVTSWLSLGAILVSLQSTGCFQSGTAPESTEAAATLSEIPSLAEIQAAVGMSAEQSAALAAPYQSWRQAEGSWTNALGQGEPPVLDFVAASASVLDDVQLGRLLAALHVVEAARVPLWGLGNGFTAPSGRGMHGGRGHGRGHRGPCGDLFADLGLTAEQIAQLRQARQDLKSAIAALVVQLRDGTLTPEEFEAGVEEARAAHETAIQAILTAEQYATLQQARRDCLIAQLQARLARFDTQVARRVAALDVILDLSDAQVAEVQTILANSRAPIEAVLAGLQDGSLSPQEAQSALQQSERETTAAIRATLTEAQAEIFDRLTALRRLFPGCHV